MLHQEEYSADFTNADNEKAVICDRENCRIKIYPPGTDMQYLITMNWVSLAIRFALNATNITGIRQQQSAEVHDIIILTLDGQLANSSLEAPMVQMATELGIAIRPSKEHQCEVHRQILGAQRGRQ